MRAAQRFARGNLSRLAERFEPGRRLFGVGRLVAETARAIDGAEQDLQNMDWNSPVFVSFAVRCSSVSDTFIDEFQPILAIYRNSTSIG